MAQKATQWLNDSFGVDIEIGKIHLQWNGNVRVQSVLIRDINNDTLIAAKNIETSIASLPNLLKGNLIFDEVSAEKLCLFITTYKNSDKNSLSIFIDQFGESSSNSTAPFILETKAIKTNNSHLKIVDWNDTSPTILELDNISLNSNYLKIKDFDVQAELTHGSMRMNKNLDISHIEAYYRITDTLMLVSNGRIQTPFSKAQADLSFHYPSGGLPDFFNKVYIQGEINSNELSSNDLNTFFKGFNSDKTLQVSTLFEGTLNHFGLKNTNIKFNQTTLKGDYSFKNLLAQDPIGLDFDITQLSSNYDNIRALLSDKIHKKIPEDITLLGNFSLSGHLLYKDDRLSTDISVKSNEGEILLKSDFQDVSNPKLTKYEGGIKLRHFHLGKLVQNTSLQHINANFNFKGKSFNSTTAKGTFQGEVSQLNFNGYNYCNFSVQSQLSNGALKAVITCNDPNLKLDGKIQTTLDQQTKINGELSLKKANLNALHLSGDTISTLEGKLSISASKNINNYWQSNLLLSNILYRNTAGYFDFKKASLSYSSEKENYRKIKLNAPDIASGMVEGHFKWKDIHHMAIEAGYSSFSTYKTKHNTPKNDIKFHLNIYNKIVEAFFPRIHIDKNTLIKGYISAQKQLQLEVLSPEIKIGDYTLKQIEFRLDTQNPSLFSTANIEVFSSPYYNVKNIHIYGDIKNDTLSFRTQMRGGKHLEDNYKINLFTTLNNNNQLIVGAYPSEIYFKSHLWNILPSEKDNHLISFSSNKIHFKDITLKNDEQLITFNGLFAENTNKDVSLTFNEVPLYNITPLSEHFTIEGILNGEVRLQQKNHWYYPESQISIQNLKLNQSEIGDFSFLLTGDESLSHFFVDSSIKKDNVQTAQLKGNIHVQNNKTLLDLGANFNGLSIDVVNSFTKDILSNVRAKTFGNIRIGGALNQMDMTGHITLKEAGLSIPFLNVNTAFASDVQISVMPNTFQIDPIKVIDSDFKTQAEFKGNIRHKNLSNWLFDLNLNSKNEKFLALNTTYSPESLFFGKAFIIGNADISGSLDDFRIKVEAKTTQGTEFNIPLSGSPDSQDDSFISFVEKRKNKVNTEPLTLRKGLSVFLDLDINPTSEVKVILDTESDNYLLAKGDGGVFIDLNTNGKFNIWGDYTIYSGTYNYAYKGVFERKFTLSPGGNIIWSGNPKTARLQGIEAIFNLYANPYVLLETSSTGGNIPTQVVVKLNGDLMHPIPTFDIRFPESNALLSSEIGFYINDKDKKQLQSLSLLAQGTFVKEQSFINNNLTSSLYGTATGFFNRLISSDDDKFNLGVSYESENITTDNLDRNERLGFTFNTHLNDRFIINGKIGVPLGKTTQTSIGSDFELQYLVNKQGTIRIKAFNRDNDFQQYSSDKLGYTQGIGLFYRMDFSSLSDLFNKMFHPSRN